MNLLILKQNLSAAAESLSQFKMITITKKAKAYLEDLAKEEGFSIPISIRANIAGGGCAGFSYNLSIVDGKESDVDEKFEFDTVIIYIDPLSYQYLEGTEIDFVEKEYGAGFKFKNPNVTAVCGCGSSFSA